MKQYEYKVITIAASLPDTKNGYENAAQYFETQLIALGWAGWELVQRTDGLFFFKREIAPR